MNPDLLLYLLAAGATAFGLLVWASKGMGARRFCKKWDVPFPYPDEVNT